MSNFSLRIASSNQYFFSNAQMYDACFLTQSSNQRLLFGVQQNAPANITVSSNLSAFSGNVSFNNMVAFGGVTINPRTGGSANLTATSILGYSNTGNGILLNIASNTSNYAYSFNGSTSNLMTIQGNGYIGINKSNPTFALDVVGDLNFNGTLRQNGSPYIGSQWSNNSSNVFIMSSNVGIGKLNPLFPLDVAGDLNFTGVLRQNGLPYVGSQWSNNSSNVFILSSNVGICTSNPQATLDINGTLNISSNVTIGGILTVSNVEYITSNITIYNSEIINSNLTVLNNATFAGLLTSSNVMINGNITAPGSTGRIWDYSGTMTISGQPGTISASNIAGSNIIVSTTMTPFSGINNEGSIYFPGTSGSYLTVAPGGSLAAPTGVIPSFTIECWINLPSYPIAAQTGVYSGIPYLIGQMPAISGNTYWTFGIGGSSQSKIAFFSGVSGCGLAGASIIPLNTWTHIAVAYTVSSKTVQLFVNGAPDTLTTWQGTVASGASTTSVVLNGAITTNTDVVSLIFGQTYSIAMNCYISNMRYTQSVLYTGSFTPSTMPLQVIDTTTKLLLRAPLQNGIVSTNLLKCTAGVRAHSLPSDAMIYADCYGTNLPNLSVGTNMPTFDTTQAMCIRFDRSKTQYLQFPPQTFNIATQGFTVICKFAFTGTIGSYENIFNFSHGGLGSRNSTTFLVRDNINTNVYGQVMQLNTTADATSVYSIDTSKLYQNIISVITMRVDPFTNYNGSTSFGTLSIWVNGILSSSVIITLNLFDRVNEYITIGYPSNTAYLNADIYTFAAYNRALTDKEIQDASATLMASSTGLPNDSTIEIGTASGKPALQIKKDGTLSITGPLTCTNNTSYAPVDMGVNGLSISGSLYGSVPAVGNSPFGISEGSLNFNGTVGNYVNIALGSTPANVAFTVEFWISGLLSVTGSGNWPLIISNTGSVRCWSLGFINGVMTMSGGSYTDGLFGSNTVNNAIWNHITVSSDGTNVRGYINGIYQGSLSQPSSQGSYIGIGGYPVATFPNNMSLTNLRIVYGAQLYTTASFTPPTAPLGPASSGTTAFLLRIPQNPGKLIVNQIGGTSTVQAYPPAAMTGNVTNIQNTSYGAGTYIISYSSIGSGYSGFVTYGAFDKNSINYWQSTVGIYNGTYNGSVTTSDLLGNVYNGEWLQIQLPVSIVLSSYTIQAQPSYTGNCPSTFYILGSKDGLSWTLVNSQQNQTWASNSVINTYNFNTLYAFQYYRIVITTVYGNVAAAVTEWVLYGTQSSINITPDGQVGIGVTNPVQSLEVAGNAIVNGTCTSLGFVGDGSQITNIPFGFRCAVYTSGNTTWTVPAGVYWVKITGTAGGGGGAGIATNVSFGGSGGAGGGTQIWRGQTTPGKVFSVNVGTGGLAGTNSGSNGLSGGNTQVYIGSTYYVNASGGGGGYIPQSYTTPGGQYVGNGASIAQINIQGGSAAGMAQYSTYGGNGGSSYFGAGGAGGDVTVVGNGASSGVTYGTGGGGARYASYGGNGAGGIVIIEY